jgi:ribosome biogenesis protein Nip4
MNHLTIFASSFGAKTNLTSEWVVEKAGRFYLQNPAVRNVALGDYYSAGLYLGKVKNGKFFPSFNYLNMLIPSAQNRVVLDNKAAWLFICGRDVFCKGIVRWFGLKRNCNTLVLNEFGECLGFGRISGQLSSEDNGGEVVVKNVLDVGDFLRRERF